MRARQPAAKRPIEAKSATNAARGTQDDFPISIAAMPVNVRQRRIAIGVVIVLSLSYILAAPFSGMRLAQIDAFVPVLQTVVCVVDLITALFIFAQYAVQSHRALLALASGYVFTGIFAFTQSLEFPGAYSEAGLLGGGLSGAAWLFVFWHTIFPAAVLLYLLLKATGRPEGQFRRSASFSILATVVTVVAAAGVMSWLATRGHDYLPSLYTDLMNQTPLASYILVPATIMTVCGIGVLLARTRTILDLWLIVTLIASLPDVTQSYFLTSPRYTVMWYLARSYTLIASSTVLVVMLMETTMLYARIGAAVQSQRRARIDRLMNMEAATDAMAHELRQPLGAIVAEGEAALMMLEKTPPDLQEAREAMRASIASGHRASDVMTSISGLFKRVSQPKAKLELNELTWQVLRLAQHELIVHGVSVSVFYQEGLPQILADRTQLQQVILNLIRNAIDAMESKHRSGRTLRLATRLEGASSVVLSIQDSGTGINPADQERIFDPFYTTKPHGMGLGLAVCRSILEKHGGSLRLAQTGADGCAFEVVLRAEQARVVAA